MSALVHYPLTSPLPPHDQAEDTGRPDWLRAMIPQYLRAGLLRRSGLPDGGIEFVEVSSDRIFATLDSQGRFVM
jgi:hypothetical protein